MRKTTLITFIFGLVILTVLAGCNDRGREANIGPEERRDRPAAATNANAVSNINTMNTNAAAAGDVKVADVTGNANNYVGKTVTVSGWVERAYGANSFRLDEDSVFTGGVDNDLLVVSASGAIPAGLKFGDADAKVRVTGTVRRMVIAEIERDYGFDLTPEIEAEFRDKPVLAANSVQVIKRDE
ncbi:MAG TPA: hypothetical protein VNI84_13555 [Pyrinomonadaceae bacterium]|nr:hypothetical protein [Pyrinomonadaceae bacterium]